MTALLSTWRSLWLLLKAPLPPKLPKEKRQLSSAQAFGNNVAVCIGVLLLVAGVAALNAPFYMARQAYQSLDPAAPPTFRPDSLQKLLLLQNEASLISQSEGRQRQVLEKLEQQWSIEEDRREWVKEWAQEIRESRSEHRPIHLNGPPPLLEALRGGLETEGFVIQEAPCDACIELTWDEDKGWGFLLPPGMDATKVSSSLRLAALQSKEDAKDDNRPAVIVSPESLSRDVAVLGRLLIDGLVHGTLLVIAWVMMGAAGFVGFMWDQHRSCGFLEPWVTARQPAWVLFVSQIARVALWVSCGTLPVVTNWS